MSIGPLNVMSYNNAVRIFITFVMLLMVDKDQITGAKMPRIVGGKPCKVDRYRYVVSIRVEDPLGDNNYTHYCGGTMLNERWVLSAAHCYSEDKNIDIDEYLVVAGTTTPFQYFHKRAQKSRISDILTKEFHLETHDNDIALLKLKTRIIRSSSVEFITLPEQSVVPETLVKWYKKCSVMGWGITVPIDASGAVFQVEGIYPNRLMCIELPILTFRNCQRIFSNMTSNIKITENQMCTLYPEGRQDACGGDSGGPLICGGLQYGITSWGIGCAQPGFPGVFSRVDKYIDWIKLMAGQVQTQKAVPPLTSQLIRKQSNGNNKHLNGILTTGSIFYCIIILYKWVYIYM